MRRTLRTLSLSLALGCGGRAPQTTWIEQEPARHDTEGAVAPPDVGKLDPATSAATRAATRAATSAATSAATIDGLDEATVVAALHEVGDAAPAGRLALRAARLARHRGDDAAARALVARAASAADEAAVHGELGALAGQLAAPPADPRVIAVLLPLSGRFSGIGSELKTAIQLAPAEGATWLFLDTKGDPEAAAAAVDDAIAKRAAGILGPVGEREAIAAARAAALRGIPIALLAPTDGADPASGVFRVVASPADEGRAVAQLAAADNFPTVAVFGPRDDVGEQAADAFVAEAKRLQLQVTARGTYDPTGGNLEPDVKQFLDLVPARNPRLAEHLARHGKKGWATFSPDIAYSLLYIPDRHDRAALVAAFLPYFGVELRTTEFPDTEVLRRKHGGVLPQVVQLVGGAGWHHPSLPVRGGGPVQGAMIVDAFPAELGGDVAAQLAASFRQRTQRTPSTAAAEAYDAATLVARARKEASGSPDVRAALKVALGRAKLADGACGPAAIGSDGELQREPAVLEVDGDQLILRP